TGAIIGKNFLNANEVNSHFTIQPAQTEYQVNGSVVTATDGQSVDGADMRHRVRIVIYSDDGKSKSILVPLNEVGTLPIRIDFTYKPLAGEPPIDDQHDGTRPVRAEIYFGDGRDPNATQNGNDQYVDLIDSPNGVRIHLVQLNPGDTDPGSSYLPSGSD